MTLLWTMRSRITTDTYGKKLLKLYPQRCLKVLANAADRQAKNSKNRCDYKYIAKTLKKIAAQPG